ncbi:MAG: hypothetical protein JJT82_03525 [Legionellaceae bacterium]|nr:hypothetical protein [Legionellaceae bacterium]
MEVTTIKDITGYFRASVLDSERLAPNLPALYQALKPEKFATIHKTSPFVLSSDVWHKGQVSLERTQEIFKAAHVTKEVNGIDLLWFPRIDLHKYCDGAIKGKQSPIMVPLVVEVSLNRSGQLKPNQSPPFIPREWLAPNHSNQIPFSDVSIIDEFLTRNPFKAKAWDELLCYCGKMLKAAVLKDPAIDDGDNDADELWRPDIHEDYRLKKDICLAQLEIPIRAGFHIVNVLDGVLRLGKANALYEKLISRDDMPKEKYVSLSTSIPHAKQHYAQMTSEFPLADKQRNALHFLSELNDGNFLAVNGPPGTGKTTLLRSVVANLWVDAALHQKAPPIIAAASSNNQAVTNIIECFAKVEENNIEETLKGRWLPEFSTYGLFACGANKSNDKNVYPYVTKQGAGIMAQMDNEAYITSAKTYFLQAFQKWHSTPGEPITCLDKAASILLAELKKHDQLKTRLLEQFETINVLIHKIENVYGSEKDFNIWLTRTLERLNHVRDKISLEKARYHEFLTSWQKRSILENIFSFLPMVKARRAMSNEIIANNMEIETVEYSDAAITQYFRNTSSARKKQLDALETSFNEATLLKSSLLRARKALVQDVQTLDDSVRLESCDHNQLFNLLDTTLRFKLFKIATHYWEAKWLLEAPIHYKDIKTPAQLLKRYQRYAKLAPCLVATFNMLPHFFSVSEKEGESWRCTPLFDAIDLLIVEEAGQALPHMVSASIVLSKKALVVGDVEQIEPVWSLRAGLDMANLQKFHLLHHTEEYQNYWLPSALNASSGNFMKVVHRHVKEHQCEDLHPGLYLTEHRRCYNEIIAYCNALVYHGHLEPLRGNAEPGHIVPAMSFIHHDSISESEGSSRTNRSEAEYIANWIVHNQKTLFPDAKKRASLAVITPFNRQSVVIKQIFSKYGLGHIPVGTIHTFQGAERSIVIFSSVYGSNNLSGKKFYDSSKNILNVAVSRAKDHFIVFGHREVLGANNDGSPSSLLRRYLVDFETEEQPVSI